jgi:hypothetical protein
MKIKAFGFQMFYTSRKGTIERRCVVPKSSNTVVAHNLIVRTPISSYRFHVS